MDRLRVLSRIEARRADHAGRARDRAEAARAAKPLRRLADRIEQWQVTRFLGVVAQFGILTAVVFFILDLQERTEARVVQAWSVVTSPACGNSGKREALHYLHQDTRFWVFDAVRPEWWPLKTRERLVGVDLSRGSLAKSCRTGTYLLGLRLPEADLTSANFGGAILTASDLSEAKLSQADLSEASLGSVDLRGALLLSTDLSGSHMTSAKVDGAKLYNVNVSAARVAGANLQDSDLRQPWAWTDRPPIGWPPEIKFRSCSPSKRADYEVNNRFGLPDGC